MRTTAVVAFSILVVAGCDDHGEVILCPEDLSDFRILAPTRTVELIPDGEPVHVTWTPRPDEDGYVEIVDTKERNGLWPVDLGAGAADLAIGADRGESPWPGVYRLRIRWNCTLPQSVINADPAILVGVQGIYFELDTSDTTIDRGTGTYALFARTASLSPADLELVFDPSLDDPPGEDAYVMYRTTLPGEIVATERRALPFTDRDVNGLDVPRGVYRVYGRITTTDDRTYAQAGPRLSWF
jgi:hypothetical protein